MKARKSDKLHATTSATVVLCRVHVHIFGLDGRNTGAAPTTCHIREEESVQNKKRIDFGEKKDEVWVPGALPT